MTILSRNGKMKKSGLGKSIIYNFGIPAKVSRYTGMKVCGNMGLCGGACYTQEGPMSWPKVIAAYEARLALTLTDSFVPVMIGEIHKADHKAGKKNLPLSIRIHDSGDFYKKNNHEYLGKWLQVMNAFKQSQSVDFYAYTKEVKKLKATKKPDNFTVIYSMGGKEDHLIDLENDHHSMVFPDKETLEAYGYVDCTDDDYLAKINQRVGLVFHSQKKWKDSSWVKVFEQFEERMKPIIFQETMGA